MNKYDDRRSHPSSSFGVVSLIHSRIWPSIHPSMLINPNLYTDPDPIASIHPSIYRPLPRRRQFIAMNGGDTQNLPNWRTIPLSTVTEGGLVSRESGVRAERGCQRRLPSPLDGRRTTRTWRFRFGDSGLRIYDDLIIRDPCPFSLPFSFLLSYFSTRLLIVTVIILLLKCVFLCMYP